MDRTVKIILGSLFILFVVLFIWATYRPVYDNFFLSLNCREEKEMRELSVSGIIKKKYIDSNEHCYRTISVLINNSLTYDFHVFLDQDSVIWLNTKINDSIIKKANTTRFFIYRNNIIDTLDINYHCNN